MEAVNYNRFNRKKSIESVTSIAFTPQSKGASGGAASTRRKQYADRQDSSVNAMMLLDPIDDEEMRRKFRNYEI